MKKEELDEFVKGLTERKIEVATLRFDFKLPGSDAMPSEVLDVLQRVRANLDRIEVLLGEVAAVRAEAARQRGLVAASHENQWAEAVTKVRGRPEFRGEFVGPRERYAQADLATFDTKRLLNDAELIYSHADEAYDFIRSAHRGMDGLRQDLHQVLRSVSFENRMDR